MGYLEPGDPFLPPDAHAARGLKVVPVHDYVDGEIEGDGDPGDGSQPNELGIAEQSSSPVMIGMKEGWARQLSILGSMLLRRTEGLFFQNHEDSIQQLYVFSKVVQLQAVSPKNSDRDGGIRT